jgi:hypothetical protein
MSSETEDSTYPKIKKSNLIKSSIRDIHFLIRKGYGKNTDPHPVNQMFRIPQFSVGTLGLDQVKTRIVLEYIKEE